ncbi:hypothetical protein D9M68_335490 [compost metagenome]|uniref:DUF7673 domain-containing protein n=1 Tax=Cupriavidus necator TaxID=106590 RepID=A0A367P7B2_CUPNE|nr:hypothetical protein [Cupriavidus necator]QQX89664.1 hypothetical protein JJQ59_34565 [Cupriavidus necator]RCJ03719.1 hypothetical protein DDK22_35815 [Cupriavidus necator]
MAQLTEEARAALERLLEHAQRDTGHSRRVADFLLAWWNAGECGGFDLTTAWSLDDDIVHDVVLLFGWVAYHKVYPDTLGYGSQFEALVRDWRPELVQPREG